MRKRGGPASAALDNTHVNWVDAKFMVVDPLGADPIVITGSGNFSEASILSQEDNMLVVRGEPAVADIYLTEFMRAFSHYAYREAVFNRAQKNDSNRAWGPRKLDPFDGWLGHLR